MLDCVLATGISVDGMACDRCRMTDHDWTAFLLAADAGDLETMERLVKAGACTDALMQRSDTDALMLPVRGGHSACAKQRP